MEAAFSIFLSASVPAKNRSREYHRVPNAQRNIEEAVIAVCRSVFRHKGRIVFGGHPTISPLVSMVASEFDWKESPFAPVVIFQSESYRNILAEATSALQLIGTAEVRWTPVVAGERAEANSPGPQCLKSLELMRTQMVGEDLDAMICIGGMDGVEKEADKFASRPDAKDIYLLPFTGGAAYLLAQKFVNSSASLFRIVEAEPLSVKEDGRENSLDLYPYPVIAEKIVRDILIKKEGGV